jgi:uncharacterized membrane protein YfcA
VSELVSALQSPGMAWVALLVLAGACLQGAGGIGFNMFAAPLVALLRPDLVPGPMLVLALLLGLMGMLREYRSIDWPGLGYALLGRLPASVATGWLITVLPHKLLVLAFAFMILAAVAMSLRGWHVAASPTNLAIAGAASGLMGTITSSGAPPMAIVYQNVSGPQLRATISAFFFIGAAVSLAALAAFGKFDLHQGAAGLALLPPLAAGFALSRSLRKLLDGKRMRPFLLGLSAFAALLLILQNFTSF